MLTFLELHANSILQLHITTALLSNINYVIRGGGGVHDASETAVSRGTQDSESTTGVEQHKVGGSKGGRVKRVSIPTTKRRSYKRHEENKRKTEQERSSMQQADYQCHRPTP